MNGLRNLFHLSFSELPGFASGRVVILVIMAVILYEGTGILYNVLKLRLILMKPSTVAAEKVRVVTVPMREPGDAYRIIAERNLFGTTTKAIAGNRAVAVQQTQQIESLISLRGTVAGAIRYGFAIIEEKGARKQRLVKVGDEVVGAKVVRIRRNAIDLLVKEHEMTLKVAEIKEGQIPPPVKAAAAPAVSSGEIVVSRGEIQNAMADMGKILGQAQVRPYFNAGAPEGFIVSSVLPGSFYQRMGIVNGDVIQEVNQRKIRTAEDVIGLLSAIKSGASLSLGIKRQGKSEILNYHFQ